MTTQMTLDGTGARIGWIDAGAGASGDMLLGALIDAGVAIEHCQDAIDMVDIGVVLRAERVHRSGLSALKIHVDVPETRTVRHLSTILEMLEQLPAPIADRAASVFERLAIAEAAVHDMAVEQVHFHEVGALDSIADIVGVAAGFEALGLGHLTCSALSLGAGHTRGAHGPIPVPVPAVVELTKGQVPVQAGPATYESTTPTGAALLVASVDTWGPMPPMVIEASGSGAGTADTDAVANITRVVVGKPQ